MSGNEEAAPGEEQVAMEPKKRRRPGGTLQRIRPKKRRNIAPRNPPNEPIENPNTDDEEGVQQGVQQLEQLDRLGRRQHSTDELRARRMAI